MKNNKINWYVVSKEYVQYLQNFDNKVQNIEYSQRTKPYIGIVLKIDKYEYYVPISSLKEKHYKMHENIDFLKITTNNKLLSVINLNNMIPIQENNIIRLEYNDISKYIHFENDKEKVSYIALLRKEISQINKRKEEIAKRARRLYELKYKFPDAKISRRCCDFKLLEKKSIEYNKKDFDN